jgi:twitching motility protein PilT
MRATAEDAPVIKLVYSILGQAVGEGASDIHFETTDDEMRVRFRVDGVLREATHVPRRMVGAVISRVKIMSDLNIAEKRVPQDGRVSVTVEDRRVDLRITTLPTQRGEGATIRILDMENAQRSLDELGMDGVGRERFEAAFRRAYGAVLVTGPTGSGKSTTLAAMVDHINKNEYGHILTIEDPIEFVHTSQKCLVNQREVHRDTHGFNEALRSALREDPDYVLVGELRDLETIRLALTAAETGHLVFGTLHTSSAAKTIDRIIDVFPSGEKPMVRSMLSESLRAVISQTLLKKVGGGRIAAHEIMVGIPAIRNLIREDKVAQMYSSIQTGQQYGMQTLDQNLQDLVKRGLVTRQQAGGYARNKDIFK